MRASILPLVALLTLNGAGGAFAAEPNPTNEVEVEGGFVQGTSFGNGEGRVFRGIPFAAPPVGVLRWHEPMPVIPWKGIRPAFKPGPPATQASFGWNKEMADAGSEDCLYLDVWAPDVQRDARLPVMVWFHGGGNVGGAAGSDPIYDGEAFVRHGVILVVAEYRLGIFAFLAHPELTRESEHHSSGNYGVLDQIAALRWVRDNISRFGGDPGNVTIFGESAGAIDVLALMTSPLTRGLFQKAIAESGPLRRNMAQDLRRAEATGAKLAGDGGHLASLSAMSVTQLLQIQAKTSDLTPFTVDGWVFPENPADVWREGRERPVPLIVGSNAIEIAFQGKPEQLRKDITDFAGPRGPQSLALYGLSGGGLSAGDPLYGNAADQWGSDLFRCFPILDGESHANLGNSVWEYELDRAIPPNPHAVHSSDLPYVFGNLRSTGSQAGAYTDDDRRLSDQIQDYWSNFARTGNPNGTGVPDWPEFDAASRKYACFTTDARVEVRAGERKPFVDLFREVLADTPSSR